MMIFTHVRKTAGTSFRFVLENTFGVGHCHSQHAETDFFTQSDLDFARKVFPGLKSIAGHNLVAPLRFSVPEPFYMTFLREPISRVISHYQYFGNRKFSGSFEKCLGSVGDLQNLMVKCLAGEENLDQAKRVLETCHFVGLMEQFDLSLHMLGRLSPHKLNLNYQFRRKTVVGKNTEGNTVDRDSLLKDRRLMDLAREHNKLDLELYRFATEEIFPRLCQKAGLKSGDTVPTYATYHGVLKPKYLAGRAYNKIYRILCKLRHRDDASPGVRAAAASEGN